MQALGARWLRVVLYWQDISPDADASGRFVTAVGRRYCEQIDYGLVWNEPVVVIAGLRFDTSGRGEAGPRRRPEQRSQKGHTARDPSSM